jgi:hypothetical protein
MRNKIVGKNKRPGSNKATGRDLSYQKEYNKKPSEVAKRVELNREARKRKIYGKRHAKGVDLSHTTKKGKLVLESRSKNRSRNGSDGRSTLKKERG